MYSYFGISDTADGEEVVKAAINRAYRDAASHVLSFTNKDDKEDACKEAKKAIKDVVIKLTTYKKDFGIWHRYLLKDLLNIYKGYDFNDGYEFTLGIAQKWINMTMKYLQVIFCFSQAVGLKFQKNYSNMIETYQNSFHVPIDSIILKAAKSDFHINCISENWSKIKDYRKYKTFQKAIATKIKKEEYGSPIDWESPKWMEYSQKTKNHET